MSEKDKLNLLALLEPPVNFLLILDRAGLNFKLKPL